MMSLTIFDKVVGPDSKSNSANLIEKKGAKSEEKGKGHKENSPSVFELKK